MFLQRFYNIAVLPGEPVGWVSTSSYNYIIQNYRSVNVNISKRLHSPKGGLNFSTTNTGSDKDFKTLPELRSLSFFG